MKKKYICVMLLVLSIYSLKGQDRLEGQLTFITSSSVYARFESTSHINIGDTLRLLVDDELMPCMIVKQKSSVSTVSISLGCAVEKGAKVFTDVIPQKKEEVIPKESEIIRSRPVESKTDFDGSLSAATYLTGGDDMVVRNMYRADVKAKNINGSKLSAEAYVTLRQASSGEGGESSIDQSHYFNVYRASLRYEMTPETTLTLGRTINSKITSLGPMDGLQAEHRIRSLYVGGIAGFRPDIMTHAFSTSMPQYGGYVGVGSSHRNFYSQSTVGFLELKNGGNIDRRYTYFQHSSTIFSKLSIFSSVEMDLYNKLDSATISNKNRLTSMYTSARYRISSKVNAMVSYDTRKRIIYYETYRTELEQLLANDQEWQGVRARLNIRPVKLIHVGLSYGRRYQVNSDNQSDNVSVFIGHSSIPKIGGRASLSINYNQSGYLSSKVVSLRHSRDIIPRKLNMGFYARYVKYSYLERPVDINQQYAGTSFVYYIKERTSLSGLGELSIQPDASTFRMNFRIIKRF